MVNVIKRDGRKQAFSPTKIRRSVESAAKDAKIPAARRRALVKEVADGYIATARKSRRMLRTSAIRRNLLTRLGRRSMASVRRWQAFDNKRRRKARAAKKKNYYKKKSC